MALVLLALGAAMCVSIILAGILTATIAVSPGATVVRSITVPVTGDTVKKANEMFSVEVISASGASIPDPLGIGTFLNGDGKLGTGNLSAYACGAAAGTVRSRAALPNALATDQFLCSRENLTNKTKKELAFVEQAMLGL